MQGKSENDLVRGRPVGDGQTDLKEQLLDEAEALFSLQGFAATSIRQIAETVNVNPALVHYYFGNKQKLLQQVMERAFAPLGQAIAKLSTNNEATVERISGLLLQMAAGNPHMPRLMVREVFLPGGEMREYFISQMAPRLGGALPALIKAEQDAGNVRTDFEPAIATLLILAVSIFPLLARDLAGPVLGVNFETDGLQLLNRHVMGLLDSGLKQ